MSFENIEAKTLGEEYQKRKDDFVYVDVRTKEEYDKGHIPAANIHIPHEEIEERYQELVAFRDKPILLICRSGVRSEIAAKILAEKGFTRLYNLKGGMLEWTGPIE